jgi:hypothetical protein
MDIARSNASSAAANKPPITAPQLEQIQFFATYQLATASLVYETHFYFIAWFNIARVLQTLTKDPAFKEARKAYSKNIKLFDHYRNARHSFEHFVDRLPGGNEAKKMVAVNHGIDASSTKIMFGLNFSKGVYNHSNETWDITKTGLDKLNAAIDEVLTVLHSTVDKLVDEKFSSL